MHVKLRNTTQSWQLIQIPTHFKDTKEQAELHSAQLVDVEVSIYPFFLNMETEISIGNHAKKWHSKRNTYKKTIAAVLPSSLF